ncbi:MAG TPA: S8 family peptidase, partial [Aquabacterium sp.]|nr:S8 family peptidase [Aquabacterium sp.]
MLKRFPIFVLTTLASASFLASAQTLFTPSMGEYTWSTTIVQLGMRNIHSSGILGQGVIVGLLDTGLNRSNPEFLNNTRVLTGYNATDGGTDVTDNDGHGTHVAGIVGAPGNGSGMYGVAPGATLLPIKVFSGNTASSTAVTAGLDYALSHGARVINMSLGATSPTGDTGLRHVAATNNAVVVIAAGNDSALSPNWPSRYAKESWANGTIITVGAVDSNKRLISQSNRAGDLAAYYLVAPGYRIISSYGLTYYQLTGTSMAAPAVSGAAALLTGYWPYLRANQVAAILLNTADDLGAPGVDAIYGHGMLNVNRALSPVGSYNYRTITGVRTRISLSSSGITSTPPSVSTPSAFGGVQTQVFDDYGRNYSSAEGAALNVHSVMTTESVMGRTDRLLDTSEKVLADGSTLMRLKLDSAPSPTVRAAQNANSSGDAWNHNATTSSSFVAYRTRDGRSLSAGDSGLSSLTLGLMGSNWGYRLGGLDALLSNPLANFAPQHRFAALGMPLDDGWSGRVATLQSKRYNAASGNVNLVEVTHLGTRHAFNISTGDLSEQGLLGGYSNAAMGLNQSTHTQGLTVSAAYLLASNWALAGAWSQTQTAAPQASGMLIDATRIRATAFGVGLTRSDWIRSGDRWSVTLNTPLSAQTGKLTYSVVSSVDESGTPQFDTKVVNLRPTAREWIAETRYAIPMPSWGGTLSTALSLRTHADNDAQAPLQWV